MKKALLLFALVALAACQKSSYTVTGDVSDFADGDTVVMRTLDWNTGNIERIDYAIVKNGVYKFKGNAKTTKIVQIECDNPDVNMLYQSEFYLEPGNIVIDLGIFGFQAQGTPLNDMKYSYMNHLDDTSLKIDRYTRKLKDESLSDHDRKVAQVQLDVIKNNEKKTARSLIMENGSNVFGLDVFLMNLSQFEPEERPELIALLSEEMCQHPRVVELTKIITAQQNTAVGQKFVDFEQMNTYGEPIFFSLIVARNKYTLLHFWSSQRNDSQYDLPYLHEVYDEYNSVGLEVVGVGIERDGEQWVNKVNELDVTWLQLSDLKWADNEAANAYGLTRLPETILVQKDGTIIARGMHKEEIIEEVSKYLGGKK